MPSMGSTITLGLGGLELDWGKNWNVADHGALFQPGDLIPIDYHYVDSDTDAPVVERKLGYSRPLHSVLQRLDLLGHTLDAARDEYDSLWTRSGLDAAASLPFDVFAERL